MKGCRFQVGQHISYGIIADETVPEVTGSPLADHTATRTTHALAEVTLLPPLIPPMLYAAGPTYRGHVEGMARRRNKKAAKKFFKKLLKGLQYVPRVLIMDKLKSYGAAKREVLPGVEHRQSCYLNNRCENSPRPMRERERRMQRFKSSAHAQRSLSAYGPIAQHFHPRRYLLSASEYRQEMRHRFESWAEITGTKRAASRPGRWELSPKCTLYGPVMISVPIR